MSTKAHCGLYMKSVCEMKYRTLFCKNRTKCLEYMTLSLTFVLSGIKIIQRILIRIMTRLDLCFRSKILVTIL